MVQTILKNANKTSLHMTLLWSAILIIAMLLVGSCRTSEVSATYRGSDNHDKVRNILFPAEQSAKAHITVARNYLKNHPDIMIHLTDKDILEILGQPEIQRHEEAADIWQYAGNECVVDIYFYNESIKSDKRFASYYEIRSTKEVLDVNQDSSDDVIKEQKRKYGQKDCLDRIVS